LSDKNYEIQSGITHLLNLNKPYEEIYKGYSDNLKRNINKANKSGLKIADDVSIDDLIRLFRENKGKEIENFRDKDYALFKKLCNAIKQNAALNNIGVLNKDGVLIAAAIFPEYLNQAVFLFSGLSDEGKEFGAMPFLINSFIKERAGMEMILDFEGSLNPNLARFYKSFGSEERTYPKIKRNLLPKPIKWLKK
jgi:lipid II:glycine glycyltransferase (peptidoglycan interpeptide bridge formation enzyme)